MVNTLAKEEALRLDALDELGILGSAPDPAIDEIVALARAICQTPIAGVCLIGSDALYYPSKIGPGPSRLPRGRRPCETAILGDGVYEISDARYHPAYRPDGIMVSGRVYRFYAAAPLVTSDGISLGCLFVQGTAPQTLNELQKQTLAVLARQIVARYELNARTRSMERAGRVRHRVESALTVERNFVSTVLDTVGALVAVFDTAGRIVRFNRACEQVSGYDFASLVGRYLWDKLIPADAVQAEKENFERVRDGAFPASFENYWKCRDGSLRRIAWSATALVDPQGQTNFIIATGIDVTVRREAEATLQESEARYRQLVEGSLGMVCTHDIDGVLLSVNAHGAASIGLTVEEIVGKNLREFMKPEYLTAFAGYLKQIRATGEAQGRLFLRHRQGGERIIAFRNKLIEVPDREPYVLGFGVDISEQVNAEERLRTLINQSNSILESVGDGIFGVDLEGRVTVVNPAAAQMLGYRPSELLGRRIHPILQHTRADGEPFPEEESTVMKSIDRMDAMRVSDEIFWRKDGTSFPVEYVARPQIETSEGRAGKAIGVVVAFTDSTERRQLERMKDEFISTVSHELRTPLTSLRAALGLITGGALNSRPEKMKKMLEIAIGNTDRLVRLVNDILDIERISSGNAELHVMLCSVSDLLHRATELQSAAALKTNIRFVISTGAVQVWGDPDRILQALANLISNAIKFSPVSGAITLTARPIDEGMVQFDVHDEGRGIPLERLESIFERFSQIDASDSRAMGGTGLGLAICRSIIDQHGGRIWATSPPGEGATFSFTLPTAPSGHLR